MGFEVAFQLDEFIVLITHKKTGDAIDRHVLQLSAALAAFPADMLADDFLVL
jgi:hypothetical protein